MIFWRYVQVSSPVIISLQICRYADLEMYRKNYTQYKFAVIMTSAVQHVAVFLYAAIDRNEMTRIFDAVAGIIL